MPTLLHYYSEATDNQVKAGMHLKYKNKRYQLAVNLCSSYKRLHLISPDYFLSKIHVEVDYWQEISYHEIRKLLKLCLNTNDLTKFEVLKTSIVKSGKTLGDLTQFSRGMIIRYKSMWLTTHTELVVKDECNDLVLVNMVDGEIAASNSIPVQESKRLSKFSDDMMYGLMHDNSVESLSDVNLMKLKIVVNKL